MARSIGWVAPVVTMWAQLLPVLVGAAAAILTTTVASVVQRRKDLDARNWTADDAYRTAVREAANEFIRAARTMESHAQRATGTHREPPDIPVQDWERFWNSHAILGLLLDEDARQALNDFGQAITMVVRNENGDQPAWEILKTPRHEFLGHARVALKTGALSSQKQK